MWCWAHGLECGVDKWKFLSPVLKQPKLRRQQQYEDFSILELLVMSVTWGRAENTFFFSLYIKFLRVISPSRKDFLVAHETQTLRCSCCSHSNQIDLSPKHGKPNNILDFLLFNNCRTN